jgi:hypothetical protein
MAYDFRSPPLVAADFSVNNRKKIHCSCNLANWLGLIQGVIMHEVWFWTSEKSYQWDGWFYRSKSEWEERTGLNDDMIFKQLKNIGEKGWLERRRGKNPERKSDPKSWVTFYRATQKFMEDYERWLMNTANSGNDDNTANSGDLGGYNTANSGNDEDRTPQIAVMISPEPFQGNASSPPQGSKDQGSKDQEYNNVASLRSSDRDRIPDQDQEEGSQEGIEHGDPEGSSKPNKGSAKSKSLPVRDKNNPYSLKDPQGFENFWAWYGTYMCSPGNSAIGSKAEAAKEWSYLERNDFHGQGRDGFRKGCAIAVKEVAAKLSKVKHARGFLRGDRTGGKQSPPMWLEKVTVVDTGDANAFLSGVEESFSVASSQSLDKSIRVELERLGMYGVLPPEWKLKTGKGKPSELTDEQKAEYLSYLRSLQSKTDAA